MINSTTNFTSKSSIAVMFTIFLILSSILATIHAATNDPPPYNRTDYILLNCGSDSTNSVDGRNWDGDVHSKFSPVNSSSISFTSTPSGQILSRVPYTTARIFQNSPFTYTFTVSPGPKFLRLYFYPATYSSLQKSDSYFSVTTGVYTLLQNFSAYLAVSDLKHKEDFIVKEFVIQVKDDQTLNLTFSPNPNSYAFINGIEILSIPTNYYIRGLDYSITYVGQRNSYQIETSTALEALYRLNVGGQPVSPNDDSWMFRSWVEDQDYVVGSNAGITVHRNITIMYTLVTPNYSAPEIVYTSARMMDHNNSLRYNMTWSFSVDSGFFYLLRLYFCEFMADEVNKINQRRFTIFINNQTAEKEADVISWTDRTEIPVFRDYVVFVKNENNNHPAKQDLLLEMYPNMETSPAYANAILNGLEIFKLNGTDGSLAGLNPEAVNVPPSITPEKKSKSKSKDSVMIFSVIGGIVGGLILVLILGFLIFRRRQRAKAANISIMNTSKSTKSSTTALPSGLCRRFLLSEIKFATGNFDDNFVIGVGGFGKVYKGYIDNGATAVAIKRLNATSSQGVREFETEIQLLSKLRHLHLVSLVGYCEENGEMILVYDYMSNGTLRDHLYKTKNSPLTWKQRLQICIGAARGLHYLHTGAKRTIIHRDVKSTNILLDEKFVAKVSDFGLSKMGPSEATETHVSTAVKGSLGYLDLEYYKLQQLTEKSDVYSFGVVLFEVLCGRPAINTSLPKEQVSLAEWARQSYRKGNLDKIVDPQIKAEIAPECLSKFGEVAYSCVKDRGTDRPSMSDIVWSLEFVLQLQESADKNEQDGDRSEIIVGSYDSISLNEDANTTDNYDGMFSGSVDGVSKSGSTSSGLMSIPSSKFKSQSVFSELMNQKAR